MFALDIETLSVESTTVVLSIAMIHVGDQEQPEDPTEFYHQLLDSAITVKLSAKQQIKDGRIVTKDVVDWWNKQVLIAKQVSFIPHKNDLSVVDAIEKLRAWVVTKPDWKTAPVWVRGSLDQPSVDSLCRQYDIPQLFPYNSYRDARTAMEIIYPKSKAGYVEVPGFDNANVIKHIPAHDCAYDLLMLMRGDQ